MKRGEGLRVRFLDQVLGVLRIAGEPHGCAVKLVKERKRLAFEATRPFGLRFACDVELRRPVGVGVLGFWSGRLGSHRLLG